MNNKKNVNLHKFGNSKAFQKIFWKFKKYLRSES